MEKSTSLLLVEGRSEESAVKEFFKQWEIEPVFCISNEGSITTLKTSFKMHLKSTNVLKKLWIILDADRACDRAWQSVRDILERSGRYIPPIEIPREGLILKPINDSDLVIGVWIMPDNRDIGMLEDFMMGIIPTENILLSETEVVISSLEEKKIQQYKNVHRAKAKLHTWLAWHDEPGDSISVAIRKNLFSQDKELLNTFRNWIMELNIL